MVMRTFKEVQVLIESWRKHYNTVRPHSSLGSVTIAQLIQ